MSPHGPPLAVKDSPMPIRSLGRRFQVNTITEGGQAAARIIELADGGFVAWWKSGEPLESDGSSDRGDVIRARIFDAAGRPLGDDFAVNQTQTRPGVVAVEALDDGGFFIVWDSSVEFADYEYFGKYIRIFDADGSPRGDEMLISTLSDQAGGGSVIRLTDGRFLSTWEYSGGGIGARFLRADGTPVGDDIQVNDTESGWENGPVTAALPGGGFVVAWDTDFYLWDEPEDNPEGTSIRARVFQADGTPAGPDILMNTSETNYMFSAVRSVEVLPTGRTLVTWETADGIKGRMMNASGTPLGDEFDYVAPTSPKGTELADGRWMESWRDVEGYDGPLFAQMKNANDNSISSVFTIDADSFFGVEPLSDGRILLVGSDAPSYSEPGGPYAPSLARFFDPTIFDGTNAAELWTGGSFNDVIRGGGGNDRLLGGAGDDRVFGGPGNNRLFGGAGNDALSGGRGGDALAGQTGTDVLRGYRGNDALVGGDGADILVGGLGRDVFRFQGLLDSSPSGQDTIMAGNGAGAFERAGRAAGDRIDVSQVDARQSTATEDAFIFRGGTGEGRLWTVNSGTNTLVRANTDRDAAVEFELLIADGAVRASAYTADDFLL